MFQRRHDRTTLRKLQQFFWPSMGFKRTFVYIKHRLVRLADSSHAIAKGLASGACVSFTPLVGVHFIQALILAWIIRGNYLAAVIGTFVGNPWTFPPMWFAAYKLGVVLFGAFGVTNFAELPDNLTFRMLVDIILEEPLRLFVPWALGAYICAAISWPFYYVIFYYLIRQAKLARERLKERRLHQTARDITGQKK
jgi:hypothetical protein